MSAQKKRKEMEKGLQEVAVNREVLEMTMKELSGMLFARYTYLQEAGFSEDQAFKIILQRGLE